MQTTSPSDRQELHEPPSSKEQTLEQITDDVQATDGDTKKEHDGCTSVDPSNADSALLGSVESATLKTEINALRRDASEAEKRIGLLEQSERDVETEHGHSVASKDSRDDSTPRVFQEMNEFLDRLEQSKLLNPHELQEAYRIADSAKGLAKRFIDKKLLTRWQAANLVAGQGEFFLGNYKLLALLCRTQKGGVYLGEHVTMHRRAAIKTLSEELSKDASAYKRFLAGARAAGNLEHPNIARVYCFDLIDNRAHLVMEHVEGRNLEKILRIHGPLQWQLAADFIRQAADGLAHAHSQGILHLRLRPSHLMLTPKKAVKLLGIGMAVAEGKMDADWSDEEIDYLAPEQALGSGVDHRAAIYSLGCLLYFLLTGKAPVSPRPIDTYRDDVPNEIIRICNKMMARKPKNRYRTADDVSWEIGRCLASCSDPKPASDKTVIP